MRYTNVCKHCFKVFKSRIRTLTCNDCRGKDESHYDEIVAYLKLYPNSNAMQIAEELNIQAFEVLKYLEEGKLLVSRGTFSRLPDDEDE